MEALLTIVPVALLIAFGFCVGGFVERAHLRRLEAKEAELAGVLIHDLKHIPPQCPAEPASLVTGEVVISSDYFKTFAAKLRNLVGGEVFAFQTLLLRGRREAIVRMVEQARAMGANRVVNVRIATSSVGAMRRQGGVAMAEVIAYGTAIFVPPDLSPV